MPPARSCRTYVYAWGTYIGRGCRDGRGRTADILAVYMIVVQLCDCVYGATCSAYDYMYVDGGVHNLSHTHHSTFVK